MGGREKKMGMEGREKWWLFESMNKREWKKWMSVRREVEVVRKEEGVEVEME